MEVSTKKRAVEIDFLRAVAIFLMTITHINGIFPAVKDPILDIFTTLGATLCFSMFLFSSAYISGIKMQQGSNDSFSKVLKRVLEIYIIYVLLALLVQYALTRSLSLTTVVQIIILKTVPPYADFLTAFITFAILTKVFFKPLSVLQQRPYLLLAISISIFFLSHLVYPLISSTTYPYGIQVVVENIFGYQELHRFPVTFYFIIYALGILTSRKNSKKSLQYMFILSALTIIILRSFNLSQWYRWPPSTLFITYGISFISFTLLIFKKYHLKNKVPSFLLDVGKYPLQQLFLTTFLIFSLYILFGEGKSVFQTILLNTAILSASYAYPIVLHRKNGIIKHEK